MRKRCSMVMSEMRSFSDNNEMHAKPDLRAVKIEEVNCSGSVISAVIRCGGEGYASRFNAGANFYQTFVTFLRLREWMNCRRRCRAN